MTRNKDLQATAILAAAGAFTAAMGDEALAGEVTVRRTGRNVFIEGGATPDIVTLTAGADGTLRIVAGDSTTLPSGQFTLDVPVGRRDKVTVALGGGDGNAVDQVFVSGVLPAMKELRVNIGDDDRNTLVYLIGADIPAAVRIDSARTEFSGAYVGANGTRVRGRLTIDGGSFGDSLFSTSCTLDGGVRADFRVLGGEMPRNSYLYATDCEIGGDVAVTGRDGREELRFTDSTIDGDLAASLGGGADDVFFSGSAVGGRTTLKLGVDAATDLVILEETTFERKLTIESGEAGTTVNSASCTIDGGAKISTRGGNDRIEFYGDLISGMPVRIVAGDGDDLIRFAPGLPVSVRTTVIADGGEGTDTLESAGADVSGAGKILPVSIEEGNSTQ